MSKKVEKPKCLGVGTVACNKKPMARARRCDTCKDVQQKKKWVEASRKYLRSQTAKDKSPEGRRLYFKDKPTLWAKSHPNLALALARKTQQTKVIPILERLVAKKGKEARNG